MRISDWSSDVCSSDLLDPLDVVGFIRPVVRFLISSSSVMPSTTSSGSRSLPFDFDILLPFGSRTRPAISTSWHATSFWKYWHIITIRPTQTKMMSKPVTHTVERHPSFSLWFFAGPPNRTTAQHLLY